MKPLVKAIFLASALLPTLWAVIFALPTPVFAQTEVHIVQAGETLTQIAREHDTDPEKLRQLNNLGNADVVWTGQRLRVPISSANDATADDATSATQAGATTRYIVQPGDSLSSIALTHQTPLARLMELNDIALAQRLARGQMLFVPLVAPLSTDSAPSSTSHLVQAGEHLAMIAARYKTTPVAIARANNLGNANLITPGQRLVIPPVGAVTAPPGAPSVDANYHTEQNFPTTTEKWIDVDLSEQRVVAYAGKTPVKAFIISSGLPGTPTVTGAFRIWAKTPLQDMSGGNRAAGNYYYLKDVPWVQYFYEGYAFHGTYWHNNFGQPMSRGCINMRNEDAQWLFEWASPTINGKGWLISSATNPGTLVMVHE